ncbi:hypothetical protein BTJ68_05530 [Hortaea werneckii EXF-2000]|nr:hypothetical protein BTJ68_05530 [Hortaea werneckii EXF-2000]
MAPSITTNAAICNSSSRTGIQPKFSVKSLKLQKHSEPTTVVGKYPRPGSNEQRSYTSFSSSVRKAQEIVEAPSADRLEGPGFA